MIAIVALYTGAILTLETDRCSHWQEQLSNGAPVRAALESKWVSEFWPVRSITCIESKPASERSARLTMATNSSRSSHSCCAASVRSASHSKVGLIMR